MKNKTYQKKQNNYTRLEYALSREGKLTNFVGILPYEVLKHKEISMGAKLLYALIFSMSRYLSQKRVFASYNFFASQLNKSRRSIQRYLKELEKYGFIRIKKEGELNKEIEIVKERLSSLLLLKQSVLVEQRRLAEQVKTIVPRTYKNFYLLIPNFILFSTKLSDGAKLLYGYIYWLTYIRRTGCVAGNRLLARLMNKKRRQIQYYLKELEEEGFIERIYCVNNHRILVKLVYPYSFLKTITPLCKVCLYKHIVRTVYYSKESFNSKRYYKPFYGTQLDKVKGLIIFTKNKQKVKELLRKFLLLKAKEYKEKINEFMSSFFPHCKMCGKVNPVIFKAPFELELCYHCFINSLEKEHITPQNLYCFMITLKPF